MAIPQSVFDEKWYYSVELEPGRFTRGFDFKNIAAARRVLDALQVKDASIVDLSTMEGMFATLLSRRGAKVLATDTIDSTARVNLLKEAYGVNYRYFPHVPLDQTVEYLFKIQSSLSYWPMRPMKTSMQPPFGFDVVLASGVMYHVLSPLHYIMTCRRLLKNGGYLVLETACAVNDEIEMHHDYRHDSFVFGGSCSWFVSTGAIDLFLRACFLEPVGFCYVRSETKSDLQVVRLGLLAKAVEQRPFDPDFFGRIEKGEIIRNYDYKPLFESAQMTGTVSKPLPVDVEALAPLEGPLKAEHFRRHDPVAYDPSYLRLSLKDR